MYTCPECGEEQICACLACEERLNYPPVVQIHRGNNLIACGYCGHTMHIDEWFEREMEEVEGEIENDSE